MNASPAFDQLTTRKLCFRVTLFPSIERLGNGGASLARTGSAHKALPQRLIARSDVRSSATYAPLATLPSPTVRVSACN